MIHSRSRVIRTCAAIAAAVLLGAASWAWVGDPPRYVIEANVRPASGGEGAYLCTTSIRDDASRQLLAAPRIRFKRGDPLSKATIEGVPTPGSTLEISVAVSDLEAVYEARLLRDGAMLVNRVTFLLPAEQY
jgi:hypothetical protein